MPAEHYRPYPDGPGLAWGYYCMRCGGVCNMYATGHGEGKCEPNPELVADWKELNK
jgi:hypothetical protein